MEHESTHMLQWKATGMIMYLLNEAIVWGANPNIADEYPGCFNIYKITAKGGYEHCFKMV